MLLKVLFRAAEKVKNIDIVTKTEDLENAIVSRVDVANVANSARLYQSLWFEKRGGKP